MTICETINPKEALEIAPFLVAPKKVNPKNYPRTAACLAAAKAAKAAPLLALSEAERLRLVKAAKSPTRDLTPLELRKRQFNIETAKIKCSAGANRYTEAQKIKMLDRGELLPVYSSQGKPVALVGSVNEALPESVEVNGQRVQLAPLVKTGELVPVREHTSKGAGRFTVITRREWSDEFRIRTEVECATGTPPPEQAGDRSTNTLSLRGARSIADSCQYMAAKKGGYSTFLTLTLETEARERVASGETTVQKEISRFWDAAQKMHARGWVNELTGNKIEGKSDSLHYCWVVENPKNEAGEDNPHAHILMKWRVPFREFEGWAARLESLWGQGFAHLEKIKEPEKAGAYMAKAAGYLTKGQGAADQGTVKGNRYGISKAARAPDWSLVGRYELGIMGSLITDTHDYFGHLYGKHFKDRRELNDKMSEAEKGSKERHQIGQKLEKVRGILNALPAVASKHQITLRGVGAFAAFMNWAKDSTGAQCAEWLPKKGSGEAWSDDTRPDSQWLAKFYHNLKHRRFNRHTGGASWWESVCQWAARFDPVPYNQVGNFERINWGFA